MSEQTFTPTIMGVDGHVLISFPNDVYLRMTADVARRFGTRIVAAAAKSEGKVGYEFLIEASE
jgi:hypothetical protein